MSKFKKVNNSFLYFNDIVGDGFGDSIKYDEDNNFYIANDYELDEEKDLWLIRKGNRYEVRNYEDLISDLEERSLEVNPNGVDDDDLPSINFITLLLKDERQVLNKDILQTNGLEACQLWYIKDSIWLYVRADLLDSSKGEVSEESDGKSFYFEAYNHITREILDKEKTFSNFKDYICINLTEIEGNLIVIGNKYRKLNWNDEIFGSDGSSFESQEQAENDFLYSYYYSTHLSVERDEDSKGVSLFTPIYGGYKYKDYYFDFNAAILVDTYVWDRVFADSMENVKSDGSFRPSIIINKETRQIFPFFKKPYFLNQSSWL